MNQYFKEFINDLEFDKEQVHNNLMFIPITSSKKQDFDLTIIPYKGSDHWIDKTIFNIHACLMSNKVPVASTFCNYRAHRDAAFGVIQ